MVNLLTSASANKRKHSLCMESNMPSDMARLSSSSYGDSRPFDASLAEWDQLIENDLEDENGGMTRASDAAETEEEDQEFDSGDDLEYDFDGDEDSLVDEERETEVAKALVKAAFDRTLSVPVLNWLISDAKPIRKKARTAEYAMLDKNTSSHAHRNGSTTSVRLSISAPHLPALVSSCQSAATDAAQAIENSNSSLICDPPTPDVVLRDMLRTAGCATSTYAAADLRRNGYFTPVTEESVDAYDMVTVTAVRQDDVVALRHYVMLAQHKSNKNNELVNKKPWQCSNKFGETILHLACRLGAVHVLDYLLHDVAVSPKVCCDFGRTPLHDMCWIAEPNFRMVAMLLSVCPDLLHITDQRGLTPLQYVTPENRSKWCAFLRQQNAASMAVRELCN